MGRKIERRAIAGVLAAVLALACSSPAPAEGDVPLRVGIAARGLLPGEPVRLSAASTVPLAGVEGRFLGRDVAFSSAGEADDVWRGWGVIALDAEPGPAVLEVTGRTTDGRRAHGTLAVTIEGKAFPEERLTVASSYVEPPAEVTRRLADERGRLAAIYARREPADAAGEPFVRPVPGEPTSVFGTRRLFNNQPRSPHPGLDLRAATGTEVLASGPGTVVLAEDLYYSGNTVIVDHGGGLFTLYAHLSRLDVAPGDAIMTSGRVGLSGATGRVTGPHLHWGAKIGDEPFDPRALLDGRLFGD